MAELKCSAKNCMYNADSLCAKGDIMVGGKRADSKSDTSCESFSKKRENETSFTSSLSHPSRTISIDCEAEKCIYNSNYKCKAEHVDINGLNATSNMETACNTFRESV